VNKDSLIMQRTTRDQINKGITVMAKGEGTRVTDQDGKSYLDLVSGVTRPSTSGTAGKRSPRRFTIKSARSRILPPCSSPLRRPSSFPRC